MGAILKNKEEMTMEQAIELAKEIERVDSALKKMKDDLKIFLGKHGEVNTGEKIWRIAVSEAWSIDKNKMKNVMEAIVLDGKTPWDYVDITSANIRKLGWSDEVLSQFATKKLNSRLSNRKVK